MKHALIFCLVLALTEAAVAQNTMNAEQIVKREMDSGWFDGHDQRLLGVLGDAGAVMVTKLLADNRLTTQTIRRTLLVLRECFADPTFVDNQNDRQPRTALLLLKYFQASTSDSEVKADIADTGKYIRERYAASASGKKN